ncbi:D-alanyl-D-alanine carboxypeptidase [Nonomuraea maritima]|uniref:D-alanyl-D-alanine carboxypeptidase n=1 Tax=Nonomuraea maritima TaxID=683260 RepID=A0A1G9HJG6_9ACTN|nr:serine hydrolase domain-containing protein [Nonomuraea maritima]SDL13097.1 D-alanyl-D-alanine carboxypeptidase [Nonomuraea maritima]
MKPRILLTLLLVLACVLASTPASAAGRPPHRPLPPLPSRDALQAILEEIVKNGTPGVLVEVRDERGTWTSAAGTGDVETGAPMRTDGKFRIGSLTKAFVSTTIMQLVQERRLRLDDSVQKWLPGMLPGHERVTIRQLLNHTSGVFNYLDDPVMWEDYMNLRYRTWQPEELVGVATAHGPLFAPGSDWYYSNTNYVLAGLIVRKVTGRPVEQEVRRRFIVPLGLRDTSFPTTDPKIHGPHARGYLGGYVGDPYVEATELNPSRMYAAGAMISTASDLNRFWTALLDGRLLRPNLLREMQQTVPALGGGYGLGISVFEPCGFPLWGHNGRMPGYGVRLLQTEDGRRQVTVAFNVQTLSETLLPLLDTLLLTEFCGEDQAGVVGSPDAHHPAEKASHIAIVGGS